MHSCTFLLNFPFILFIFYFFSIAFCTLQYKRILLIYFSRRLRRMCRRPSLRSSGQYFTLHACVRRGRRVLSTYVRGAAGGGLRILHCRLLLWGMPPRWLRDRSSCFQKNLWKNEYSWGSYLLFAVRFLSNLNTLYLGYLEWGIRKRNFAICFLSITVSSPFILGFIYSFIYSMMQSFFNSYIYILIYISLFVPLSHPLNDSLIDSLV